MKKMFLAVLLALAVAPADAAPPLELAQQMPAEAGVNDSILTGLGPLFGTLGTPTNTIPITTTGIVNTAALTTSATKVVSAVNATASQRVRRLKIVCLTSGRNCSYTTVVKGASAPSLTAVGDGTATDGSIMVGGGGAAEWVNIPDNVDFYMAASAASTAAQITLVDR